MLKLASFLIIFLISCAFASVLVLIAYSTMETTLITKPIGEKLFISIPSEAKWESLNGKTVYKARWLEGSGRVESALLSALHSRRLSNIERNKFIEHYQMGINMDGGSFRLSKKQKLNSDAILYVYNMKFKDLKGMESTVYLYCGAAVVEIILPYRKRNAPSSLQLRLATSIAGI